MRSGLDAKMCCLWADLRDFLDVSVKNAPRARHSKMHVNAHHRSNISFSEKGKQILPDGFNAVKFLSVDCLRSVRKSSVGA